MSFEGEILQRLSSIETEMKHLANYQKRANGRTSNIESQVLELQLQYARRKENCLQDEAVRDLQDAAISRKAVRGFILAGIAIIATLSSIISTLISFAI